MSASNTKNLTQQMKELLHAFAPALAILMAALYPQAAHAERPVDPPGTYSTSWLGNTYMDANGHKVVTEELTDLCVSPGGHVFSAGYAEAFGGGAEYSAAEGGFIARYDRFDSGFGDPVKAVAADASHVFWGTPGKGFLRSAQGGGGAGTYTTFLGGKIVTGLSARNGKLYVSNFSEGKIHVYDIATMTEERSWACVNPTRLTVDNAGNVWVIRWNSASPQKPHEGSVWWGEKVVSFSAAGVPGPEIADFEKPLAIAVNKGGQLLIGGLNRHSQIWIYNLGGTPAKVGTFGAQGGIFSAPAGAFEKTARLHWIKAIAVDASDAIYTGCTYGTFWGNCIEKWNPEGALQWRLFAGTSLDGAGIDPEHDTEVYSKYHHYSLDYSRTVPGTEWSLKGFTVNRFKYPNDPRVDQNSDVGSRALGAGAWRIGGRLFVGRSSQEGYRLELYRQETSVDGEVLVPSFRMGAGGDASNHFYNPQTQTWTQKPKKDGHYNQYWNIAKNGDLLTIGDPQTIIHYKFGGLDAIGNPIWDAAIATTALVAEFKPVRRLFYDSDADVMYLAGDVKDQNWGSFLRVKKFPNWAVGNRASSYTVNLPYQDAEYAGSSNYGGGQPAAFSVVGDYIFILYGVGHVRVLNKTDGSLVGTLRQNVNGWKGSDGQVDAAYGMTVTQRKNGEYVILFENAAWANIMMTRWRPDGVIPFAAAISTAPPDGTTVSDNSEPPQGFTPLFSEDALKRWRQCGPGQFVVTNGVATAEGGMGLWWYAGRQFTNFVLRGEFMQEQDMADSGVFLRFPDPGQDPWVAVHQGHEMEIGDPAPKDPTWRTGSIYPFAASTKANTKPLGQWNTFEIICDGQDYTVRINDEVVTRWTDPKARTSHGFIGLQNYNDHKTVRHRRLLIRELP